jgi:hypothetical protein
MKAAIIAVMMVAAGFAQAQPYPPGVNPKLVEEAKALADKAHDQCRNATGYTDICDKRDELVESLKAANVCPAANGWKSCGHHIVQQAPQDPRAGRIHQSPYAMCEGIMEMSNRRACEAYAHREAMAGAWGRWAR